MAMVQSPPCMQTGMPLQSTAMLDSRHVRSSWSGISLALYAGMKTMHGQESRVGMYNIYMHDIPECPKQRRQTNLHQWPYSIRITDYSWRA